MIIEPSNNIVQGHVQNFKAYNPKMSELPKPIYNHKQGGVRLHCPLHKADQFIPIIHKLCSN